MKKLFVFLIVLVILLIFQRCDQDDDLTPLIKTKVTFGFSTLAANNGRIKTDVTDSTMLVISIETTMGKSVYSHYTLKLLSFGDNYVTDPVELFPGDFVITDFMLVNKGDVRFATPQSGSPLSSLVKHPLPYTFKVARNKVDNFQMEVVSVDEQNPEDFGYASFHINVVRPLLLSVFAMGSTPKLTSAKAYLLKFADTVEVYLLGAKVNTLSFKHDPHETYRLIIQKEGYTRFDKIFVYSELMTELNGHPLIASLEPAMTIQLSVIPFENGYPNSSGYIIFYITTSSDANFTIDWGDGQFQPLSIQGDNIKYMWHVYSSGSYYITITGDLEKIIEYRTDTNNGDRLRINFDNLPELKTVNLFSESNSDVLDIRKNYKIETIVFGGKTLLLPFKSNLKAVVIFNYDLVPSLDNIISYVYSNAVARNISDGSFEFVDNPDSGNPIGNPSEDSLWKIDQLRSIYRWQFNL